MPRSLVIVESPAKAKTINKYLGRNYLVKASVGHVLDLPRKTIGIRLPDEPGQNGTKRGKKKKTAKGKKAKVTAPHKPITLDDPKIFEPTLQIISGKGKVINDLRKYADTADAVYLAGDPDREGEAISAHLAMVLSKPAKFIEDPPANGSKDGPTAEEKAQAEAAEKAAGSKDGKNKKKTDKKGRKSDEISLPPIDPKKIFRVTFNEITPKAIRAAFEHPRQIDTHLVDAQQARRVLDRIVGYKISPLLWDKVRRGLSAGRVQTVALRLITDREREIRAFKPEEYWTIHAMLAAGEPPIFEAKLAKHKGEEIEIHNQAEADAVVAAVQNAAWQVAGITQREKRRNAPPPFTTSKLQQAAYNRLRYGAKRTMGMAQRMYEGVELGEEGSVALITYMRTDSVHVSSDALAQVREHIAAKFGSDFLPEKPNFYKNKKDAQEAHEAVRPTDVSRTPADVRKYLSDDMFRLYQLIWQRFVASQMVPAVYDQTSIDIAAGDYTFRASGSVMKFEGFLAAYQVSATNSAEGAEDEPAESDEGRRLPAVREGERLRMEQVRPEQHFTEPPPRYSEATLVKELEEKGIGRPSTYASIISTIVEREYVTKEQGRFTPTMLGGKVADLLVKSFEDIFDVGFTARMEEELDEIEEGKLPWKQSVKEFYARFEQDLGLARDEMQSYKAGIPTGRKCEKCGKGELLERISRLGFFLGCSRYPDCDFIEDLSPELPADDNQGPEACPECGREMVVKRGRWGNFLACTGYPDCQTTRRLIEGTRRARQADVVLDEKCPDCGSPLLQKHGRYGEFIGCSGYPKCKFIRSKTLGIKCPKCGTGELLERMAKRGRRFFYGCNRYPECDFTTPNKPIAEPCPKCGAPFVVEKKSKIGLVRACLKEGCDYEVLAPELVPTANPEPAVTAHP